MTSSIDALAAQIKALQSEIRAIKTTPQLAYSSIVDGAIEGWTGDGTQTMVVGQQYDGTNGAVAVTGPTPPKPSLPVLTPVPGGIKVMWDGTYDTGDPTTVAPMDWARVDLVASVDPNFDAIATPPVNSFQSPRGGEIFVPGQDGITYTFALVTRAFTGKASVPSERASDQPLPSGGTGAASDGQPPQSAPVLHASAGERLIFIKIDGVTNADPVTYDIYASTTSPVPYAAGNLVGSTPSTLAVVSAMTDGTPVSTSAPTYFMAVARDADGAGPQSAESSATAKATPTAADLQGVADTSTQAQQDAAASAQAAQTARDDAAAAQTAAQNAQAAADAAAADSSTSASDAAAAQTAAQNAQQAASDAEARATAAEQDAANSATSAGQAATSANGTSRVWYLPNTPPTTDRTNKDDDTWFQTVADANGNTNIAAVYRWDSSAAAGAGAWVARALSHEVIASLDAGKIVTGEMDAVFLKAGSVTAREVAANSIGANEISSDYAYLGDVTADQIKSGSLAAAIALVGSMTVGDPASRHITIDTTNGFLLAGSDGKTQVHFPITEGAMNTFDGNLTARGFTALDGATFMGANNIIGMGSTFTLASGTTAPTNYPTVNTKAVQSISGASVWMASFTSYPRGLAWNGTEFFGVDANADNSGAAYLRFWNPSTNASRTVQISLLAGNYSSGATRLKYASLFTPVYLNGYIYMFVEAPLYDVNSGNSNNRYQRKVAKFNASTGAEILEWNWETWTYSTANVGMFPDKPYCDPALATDGTSLYTAQLNGTDKKVYIRRFDTVDGPSAADNTITSNTTLTTDTTSSIASLAVGTLDYGTLSYMVKVSANANVNYLSSAGTVSSGEAWAHPAGSGSGPFFLWWPTEARLVSSKDNDLVRMSKLKSTAAGKAAFSWYDSNATGGTHETQVGPSASFTRTYRYGVQIDVSVPLPSGGGADDPNTARIYAYADGATSLHWQADGMSVLLLDGVPTGGAAPSSTNTFGTTGTASVLQSAQGGFVVRGDGSGAWPSVLNPITDRITPLEADKWEVGDIKISGRNGTSLAKWLYCDGTYVSQTTYSALYAQLGHSNSNGVDPGNGTFRLPDFRNRYPIGAGYSTALGSNDGTADGSARLNRLSHAHYHTQADISGDGNHSHGIASATSSATNKAASGTATVALLPVSTYDGHNHGGTTTGTGTHTHVTPNTDSTSALASGDNGHPYQAVNFWIKALP